MNPKNIQLTDSALKELTTNLDGSPVEEPEEYIKNSKNEILSNITKSIKKPFSRRISNVLSSHFLYFTKALVNFVSEFKY